MDRAALSLDQAPPLSVPARFFLTAPLFGVAAALIDFAGQEIHFVNPRKIRIEINDFLQTIQNGFVQPLLTVFVAFVRFSFVKIELRGVQAFVRLFFLLRVARHADRTATGALLKGKA